MKTKKEKEKKGKAENNEVQDKKDEPEERLPFFCRVPFREMVVFANGTVSVCCNFFEYLFDKNYKKHGLDNVKNQSLEEVWKGKVFTKFRDDMFKGKLHQMCKNCSHDMRYHDEVKLK